MKQKLGNFSLTVAIVHFMKLVMQQNVMYVARVITYTNEQRSTKGKKTSILCTQREPQTMAVSNEENMLDNIIILTNNAQLLGYMCRVPCTYTAHVSTYARNLACSLKVTSA